MALKTFNVNVSTESLLGRKVFVFPFFLKKSLILAKKNICFFAFVGLETKFLFFSLSLVVCVWHSPIKINLSSALNRWRQISHTRPFSTSPDKTKTNFRFFLLSCGRHRSNLNLRGKRTLPAQCNTFITFFRGCFFRYTFSRDKGGNHLLIYYLQTQFREANTLGPLGPISDLTFKIIIIIFLIPFSRDHERDLQRCWLRVVRSDQNEALLSFNQKVYLFHSQRTDSDSGELILRTS